MKQFNFTLSDETAEKLKKIKEHKELNNNSETISFLVSEVFRQLFKEAGNKVE